MADRDIKLDAPQTLAEITAIADTVRQVAVPGPVPEAAGETPIDQALAAVANAQRLQAAAWATALQAMADEHEAKSINAVHMLEATEDENSDAIARVFPESGGAGVQNL